MREKVKERGGRVTERGNREERERERERDRARERKTERKVEETGKGL